MVKKKIALFFLFAFTLLKSVVGQHTVELNDNTGIIKIGKDIAVYEDKTALLNLEDVRSLQYDSLFKQSNEDIINFNVSRSAFWCKTLVRNNSSSNEFYLEQMVGSMLSAECFIIKKDTVIKYKKGLFDLFSERDPSSIYPTFTLNLPKDSSCLIYMRLTDHSPFSANLNLGSPKYFLQKNHTADLLNGLYFGMMFILMLYNLFIFLSVKERSYIYYMFYILFASIFISLLTGYFSVFPVSLKKIIASHPAIMISLFGLFAMLFTVSFLNLKQNSPGLYKTFLVMLSLLVISILLSVSGYKHESIMLIQTSGLLLGFFSILSGYVVLRKGHQPAKYYMVAWSVYMTGLIAYIFTDFGILPFNMLTHNSLQLGSVFEAIFLSVALADKVNTFKEDKELAQEKALEIAHENEKLIREQNIVLERKVKERTQEIEDQKKIIEVRQKEILDSIHYAKRIQRSLLPSEKYIEKTIKKN